MCRYKRIVSKMQNMESCYAHHCPDTWAGLVSWKPLLEEFREMFGASGRTRGTRFLELPAIVLTEGRGFRQAWQDQAGEIR